MSEKDRMKVRIILPKFYKNFILLLIGVTVIVGAGFAYYTFGSAKITIQPSFEQVGHEAVVTIKDSAMVETDQAAEVLFGRIFSFALDETITLPATGKKEIIDDTVGTVTLVNNYSKDQTLIATTRLLSASGVMLRLKNEVVVPAGTKVEGVVYPDKPEEFTELPKTTFTIPGLWPGIQDKIFAESTVTLKKGKQLRTVVTEEDIKNVDSVLGDKVDAKILDRLKLELPEEKIFYSKLIQKDITEKIIDGKPGDERETIQVKVKGSAVTVVFDEIQLLNIMRRSVSETLSAGKQLKDIDPKSVVYTVEDVDLDDKTAALKVSVKGTAVVKSDNALFDEKKILGMKEQEMLDYFDGFDEVKSVQAEFSPGWLRRVPRAEDKVEIIVAR